MKERAEILASYKQLMADLWKDQYLTVVEIQTLKVYCEVHQLTVAEHESVVDEINVDRRQLIDEYNRPFADWLRTRRQPLAAGSGGLRFAPQTGDVRWKKRLPRPPAIWQSVLAGVAALLVIGLSIALILH